MGRCWTWYASIGGSTRPIPLSKGAGVWCISSHVTTTYHCWVVLCPLKMPLGKYVARHPRGCGMCVPCHQGTDQRHLESGSQRAQALGHVQAEAQTRTPIAQRERGAPIGTQKQIYSTENQ